MALQAVKINVMDTPEPRGKKRDKRTKNIDMIDECGKSRLHTAVIRRNIEKVQSLLERGAIVNVLDPSGYSPLHWAVRKNDLEMIKLLIAYGADVNIQEITKYPIGPPIQTAIDHKNKDLVRFLLENGANPNEKVVRGCNVFLFAIMARKFLDENTHYEILRSLMDHGADFLGQLDSFHRVIRHGSERAVRLFIDRGIDLSTLREKSGEILHDAAFNTDENVLKYLVKTGHLDLNQKFTNKTALYITSCLGKTRSAKCLLKYGANIDEQNFLQETALFASIRHFRTNTLRLLLSRQANVNIKNEHDHFLLEAALLARRPDVTYEVLRYLALISEQNRYVDPANFELIKVNPNLEPIFGQFLCELRLMKLNRLSETVTMFDLLDTKKIINFVKDDRLVEAFQKQCLKEYYPYYYEQLIEPFYKQLNRHKMKVAAVKKLRKSSIITSRFDESTLFTIFDCVSNYLKKTDLYNVTRA